MLPPPKRGRARNKNPHKKKPHVSDRVAVIDFETDPFMVNRIPAPFAAGFYDGEMYRQFWGADCARQLAEFIRALPGELIIYAHNGGKFDFLFLVEWLTNNDESGIRMIQTRIVEARLGEHRLRDSFSIIPVPLKSGGSKKEIDYSIMEPAARERPENRAEILAYLEQDCRALYILCHAFAAKFGRQKIPLTIGSTAERALHETLPNRKLSITEFDTAQDDIFRAFYFGGRVECFETGIARTPLKMFDVNSMYPGVMRNYAHPDGRPIDLMPNAAAVASIKARGELPGNFPAGLVYFVEFDGYAKHIPTRNADGTVYAGESTFFACSHEVRLAFKTRNIRIDRIRQLWAFPRTMNFAEFVDKYYEERKAQKAAGDKVGEIFSKLLLNSSYGRFALNPRKFRDTWLGTDGPPEGDGWEIDSYVKFPGMESDMQLPVYGKPQAPEDWKFKNVAIAASITSAARAVLAQAIMASTRPLYCDTDSIVCADFHGDIDPGRLGAWKHECDGDRISLGGKKTYAIWMGDTLIKKASKGARLTGDEIDAIALGDVVTYTRDAPAMSLKNGVKFITRKIRATHSGGSTDPKKRHN